jgi:hypothetical protein
MKDLSDPFLKEKIINSLQYRVTNKLATSVGMNYFPEFVQQEIDNMYRENNTNRKILTSDPFHIIQKPAKERTLH